MKDGTLYDQASAAPTRKMLAVAIAGILTALLTSWAGMAAALSPWLAWLDHDLVKAGLPVLAAFAAGYAVRERARGAVRPIDAARPDDPPPGASLRCWAALALLVGLLILPGCTGPQWMAYEAFKGEAKANAERLADEHVRVHWWALCRATPAGAIERNFGALPGDHRMLHEAYCQMAPRQ